MMTLMKWLLLVILLLGMGMAIERARQPDEPPKPTLKAGDLISLRSDDDRWPPTLLMYCATCGYAIDGPETRVATKAMHYLAGGTAARIVIPSRNMGTFRLVGGVVLEGLWRDHEGYFFPQSCGMEK